jgi:predicted phosphoadenosine phosphosulfate sulfurtransferase
VIFRDEELIPDQVIDFVNAYRQLPWVRMLYFAVPLKSNKYILGRSMEYVQWDPNRQHLRPVPEHAITLPAGDDRVFDQYSMDGFAASYFKGKVGFITGIRAAESLMRFRASVNKLNENYITGTTAKNVSLVKPLYDWQENDIFKFFYDGQIKYCDLYDAQHLAGEGLRVSTPLHSESAKRIGKLREISPNFYRQIMNLFPEMLVQERYFRELDSGAAVERYGQSFEGIRSYILEKMDDEHQQAKALQMLSDVMVRARRDPGAYPVSYVLKYFMGGSFKRQLLPLAKSQR